MDEKRPDENQDANQQGGNSMSTVGTIVTVAGVVALGAVAYEGYKMYDAYQRAQDGESVTRGKTLEEAFGEPMHTGTFTLSEATTWLKSHFREGCEGVIVRTDCAALKKFAPNLNLGEADETYLVMIILDKVSKVMRDSVLVKFEALDSGLKEALGDEGMLVIEP